MKQNYNPKLLYDIEEAILEEEVLKLRYQLDKVHEEYGSKKTKRNILQKIGIWK